METWYTSRADFINVGALKFKGVEKKTSQFVACAEIKFVRESWLCMVVFFSKHLFDNLPSFLSKISNFMDWCKHCYGI